MIYITDNALLRANTVAILTQQYDEPAKLVNTGENQAILETSNDGIVWTFLASIAPKQAITKDLNDIFIRNISNGEVYINQRSTTHYISNELKETPNDLDKLKHDIVEQLKPLLSNQIATSPNNNLSNFLVEPKIDIWEQGYNYAYLNLGDTYMLVQTLELGNLLPTALIPYTDVSIVLDKMSSKKFIETTVSLELSEIEVEKFIKSLDLEFTGQYSHTIKQLEKNKLVTLVQKVDVADLSYNQDIAYFKSFGANLGIFRFNEYLDGLSNNTSITLPKHSMVITYDTPTYLTDTVE